MLQRVIAIVALFAIAAALFVGLSTSTTSATEEAAAEDTIDAPVIVDLDEEDAVSYAIGYNLGRSFQTQGVEINAQELLAGVRAGLGEQEARMSEEQVQQVLTEFSFRMQQQYMEQRAAEAAAQREQGEQFLAQNGEQEGVRQTDSGLQYQVIESGEGASPGPEDTVVVHYTGRFIDGEVFDSSRERGEPVQFPLNQVIAGWTEGLQLMNEGGRYMLFVPSDLAYGEEGRGDAMPPNATLIFDIELLEVHPASQ